MHGSSWKFNRVTFHASLPPNFSPVSTIRVVILLIRTLKLFLSMREWEINHFRNAAKRGVEKLTSKYAIFSIGLKSISKSSRCDVNGMQISKKFRFFYSTAFPSVRKGSAVWEEKKIRETLAPSIDSMKRHGVCYSSLKNTWPSKTLNLLFLHDTRFYTPL